MKKVREWLRAWLFGEETSHLKTLMYQVDSLKELVQLVMEQNTQTLLELEKLEKLLAPQAPRLRAGRAPVLDWDEVQRQNLREFDEKGDRR